jgi:hypothetical protein
MPPRPGTKHAKQLYEYLTSTTNSLSNKYTILQTHLDKYHEAVGIKSKKKNGGDKEFIEEDKWINNDMSSEVKARGYLTRDELIRLMNWKLHHGKFRGTLKGNIKKNTAASVEKISKNTIALMSKAAAETTCISDQLKKDAVKQFSKLISVGPATASAFLSFMYPINFAFMSDEPLEAFTGRRKWELGEYLVFNEEMVKVAQQFEKETVNPLDIEKALWCAGQIGFQKVSNGSSKRKLKSDDSAPNKRKKA